MNAPLCARWLRAEAYVADVLSGAAGAGRLERQAAARHARDVQRAAAGGPWRFDAWRAEKALRFIESLPHVAGELAAQGRLLTLEGWQAFCIGSIFGWVAVETGLRRYRTAYLEVARKNGKSTLLSGVSLYCLALDGEAGAQVYSAATTKEQARKVFDPAREMARRTPALLNTAGVRVLQHRIEHPGSLSVFLPLASQTNSLDGSNPHCTVVDELHAHLKRDVWDVMGSGSGARRQPLMMAITTAGSNLAGVCYEERAYLEKILAGVFDDDRYFGVIYAIDDEDDPFDPAIWRKANPNIGVSVDAGYLAGEAAKAGRIATRRGEFLRKHCCRWSAAGVGAFDFERWKAAVEPDLTLADFANATGVLVGLDGSKTDDLTSLCVLGWRGRELLVWTEHWASEDAAQDEGADHLRRWADEGWLTLCPGALIDMGLPSGEEPDGAPGLIHRRLLEIAAQLPVAEVAFDPMYMGGLAQALAARWGDAPALVEQRQNVMSLDPPLRTAQGLIRDGRIRHRDDPVMNWMVLNARAKPAGEFLRLFKQSPVAKIDGVQAMLTGMARMEAPAEERTPQMTGAIIRARGGLL
jgi:phage terminase large subunit-like protein